MNKLFVDVDFFQVNKKGEQICGDAFFLKKMKTDCQVMCVLSDGLGSGVKANILATMTASMAMSFTKEDSDIIHAASVIKSALPVCRERKISYATFSIIKTFIDGRTSIVEMGNPSFILFNNDEVVDYEFKEIVYPGEEHRNITTASLSLKPGDRLIFVSDGITQAGMGSKEYPLGWRRANLINYISKALKRDQNISAHNLSRAIVSEAITKEEGFKPCDDMTAAVIYYREPKKLLIFTGPPYDKENDVESARILNDFPGTKVICGGTTAAIIAKQLNKEINVDLRNFKSDLPPVSKIEGFELVTEGVFTLTRTASYLEDNENKKSDPARQLTDILREHDIIEFLVGTRINEAHQAPDLPVDLEIRRNIVKRIRDVLEKKYLKTVKIKYI